MTTDDTIISGLPLPLSQLLRRAANAKAASDRLLTAYYAWEAALKLLGSVAIVEYAALDRRDGEIDNLLKNLARPTIGRWWEFVRRLVPLLAESGDAGFAESRRLVLGRTRDDLPFAAGLDGALRETLGEDGPTRMTVRLTELFNRLVDWRNRELAHGAACQQGDDHADKLGRTMFAGIRDLLGKVDVLAGRRLLFVRDVRCDASGDWVVECLELRGESPKRIEPVIVPRSEEPFSVRPARVYLAAAEAHGAGPIAAPPAMRSLHPLLLFDDDENECLFLNARRGQRKAEYLCYTSGRQIDREGLENDRRQLLVRVLGGTGEGLETPLEEDPVEEEEPAIDREEAAARTLGEFELLSKIGQGGMGVVYRAWQPSLGRQVAVKSLIRSGEADAVDRFGREIRVLGRVEHPNVVKIYTSGVDGDNWYFAMELVEGAPLSDIQAILAKESAAGIRTPQWQQAISTACENARARERSLSSDSRPETAQAAAARSRVPESSRDAEWTAAKPSAPVEQVVAVVRQAAEATQALHAHGVIHRDIKPGNIMISADGRRAVLMDLGLAQLADESEGRLTRTRQFVGTLRYASPEQIVCAHGLDAGTDVYSLGATLWELLTLRPLYGATEEMSPHELMVAIQQKTPERIRAFNPAVPPDLEAIVFKCLEKDRRQRYDTAGALADDLRRWQQGDVVRARRLTPWYFLQRKVARNRRKIAWAGGGVLAVAAAFWLLLAWFVPHPDNSVLRKQCATVVETLPGLNGDWWFDETPWLIPPVREAIARGIREGELPCENIPELASKGDKRGVCGVLQRSLELVPLPRWESAQVCLQELVEKRDRLRETDQKQDERRGSAGASGQLAARPTETCPTRGEPREILQSVLAKMPDAQTPTVLHTKAVLYHQLALLHRSDKTEFQKHLNRAATYYRQAKGAYAKDDPLRYLCLTDLGRLLGVQLFDEAGNLRDENLEEMDGVFKEGYTWEDGRGVFSVSARVSHADALLKAKEYERADRLFEKTFEEIESLKLAERTGSSGHPLVALTHERYAWSLMDQWRVEEAAQHFKTASEIRKRLTDSGDRAAWRRYCHDLHGLAMADRYCGRRDQARQGYQALVGEDGRSGLVGQRADETRTTGRNPDARQAYVARALKTRQQNSCERYADCALYAWSPAASRDPAFNRELEHAALLYRRAQEFVEDLNATTWATMGYKRALTLLLLGKTSEAEEVLVQVEGEASNVDDSSDSDARRVSHLRLAVDAVRQPPGEKQQQALRTFLKTTDKERDKPANDNRDTFELRLLCAKRLLGAQRGEREAFRRTGDALSFIANVLQQILEKRRQADDDECPEFVRDYWDLAIDAVDAANPEQAVACLIRPAGRHWAWKSEAPHEAILAVNLPMVEGADGLAILLEARPGRPHPDVRFFPLAFDWTDLPLADQANYRLRVPDGLQRYVRRHDLFPKGCSVWSGGVGNRALQLPADLQGFKSLAYASLREERADPNGEPVRGTEP